MIMADERNGAAPAADAGNFEGIAMPAATPPQQARPDTTQGYSPARDAREAAQAREPEKVSTPDGGESFKFGADLELSASEIADLMKFKAEQAVRATTLPASPDNYEAKVPDTFKAPGDAKFEFNKDDPDLKQLQQLAHSRQWDQATFSDVPALHAAREISKQTIINNARNTELAKLGTMAPQRIDAVKQWAHGTLGSALGGAIEQMLVSARHVEAFEKIISNASRQGGTQFGQNVATSI
jgi:hypothetical protein